MELQGILGPGILHGLEQVPLIPELPHDQIVWGEECWIKPKVKLLYEQVLTDRPSPATPLVGPAILIKRLWSLPVPPTVRRSRSRRRSDLDFHYGLRVFPRGNPDLSRKSDSLTETLPFSPFTRRIYEASFPSACIVFI